MSTPCFRPILIEWNGKTLRNKPWISTASKTAVKWTRANEAIIILSNSIIISWALANMQSTELGPTENLKILKTSLSIPKVRMWRWQRQENHPVDSFKAGRNSLYNRDTNNLSGGRERYEVCLSGHWRMSRWGQMEFSLKLKEDGKAEAKPKVHSSCREGEACEKGERQLTTGQDRMWSLASKAGGHPPVRGRNRQTSRGNERPGRNFYCVTVVAAACVCVCVCNRKSSRIQRVL